MFSLVDFPEFWISPFTINRGPWLGGYQDPADTPAADANWNWVTGESWGYTDWYPGNPDDFGGLQDKLHFSRWSRNAGLVLD